MVDAVNSGYKEEAQTVGWTGATRELASLADNEWTDLSDEVDNSSLKYLFMDLELVLASAAFTGTDSVVSIYVIPSVDGTNYPNWTGDGITAEQENEIHFIGSVTTSGATEAQRLVLRNVACPPGKFKFGVRNTSGVAFAASSNTLKYRRWNYASQ